MLLCSLVLSQLDYLNSVLTNLPKATLRPYNYTQICCQASAWDCMKMLHWLQIEFRTKFKLLTIVFKTIQGNGPSYLWRKLISMTYHKTTRRSTTKGITLEVPFNKKRRLRVIVDSHIQQQHTGINYLNTSDKLRILVSSGDC